MVELKDVLMLEILFLWFIFFLGLYRSDGSINVTSTRLKI